MSTTSILIRDLPFETKAAIKALAQKHQHSMAEEARQGVGNSNSIFRNLAPESPREARI